MSLLSVIIPCYNEEAAIPYFYDAMQTVAGDFSQKYPEVEFEYILIDDGSTDKTLEVIKNLRDKDKRVHFTAFSRNFGKEAGMLAGLTEATGDYVAVMDADLQDPPELLPEMYKAVKEEGYDCAATRRVNRKGEPPVRSFFARMFYRIMNRTAKLNMMDGARDYRFMKRVMVDAILSMKEYHRFSKGIFGWVGFQTKWIDFTNRERVAGKTKWSFFSLFRYSLEGIVAFSTAPLEWASFAGLFFCFLALVFLIFLFVRALLYGDPVIGWPSLACMITFFSGLQLFVSGIIGMYLI